MHRINIVGSGTAGLTAAIYAAIKYNAEVNIYTDSRLGKSNSCMAQSGYRWKSNLYTHKALIKEAKNILSSRLIDEIQNGDDVMNLLGIKEGETDKDAGTIDQLSSLRMVRDKESKIGVKLIKKLVGKVHEEQKINIYEDHVVKFKKYSFDEFETYDIKKKTKIFLPSEMTILAIGGGLGADGKISTNMRYKDYSIIIQLVENKNMKIQYHPFGIMESKRSPLRCIPECIAINGKVMNERSGNEMNVKDFKDREECVKWLDANQGDNFLILGGEKRNYYQELKRKGIINGDKIKICKAEHYLLEGISDTKLYLCGECRNGDFIGYRPAGMGITQSILSAKTAVDQILG